MKKQSFFMAGLLVLFMCIPTFGQTILGISQDGKYFTINGVPTWIQEITYFTPHDLATENTTKFEKLGEELDAMKSRGINCIRIWLQTGNWDWDAQDWDQDCSKFLSFSPYVKDAEDGSFSRNPAPNDTFRYWHRIRRLLEKCDEKGIIVDISLLYGGPSCPGTKDIKPNSVFEQESLAGILTTDFSYLKNWYLDIENEWAGHLQSRSMDEAIINIGLIRTVVQGIDSGRLCTASCGPYDAETGSWNAPKWTPDRFDDYCDNVDFVAIHENFYSGAAVSFLKDNLPSSKPIHCQEPNRRGKFFPGTAYFPAASEFIADLRAAAENGAAGWCFHNFLSCDFNGTGNHSCSSGSGIPKSGYMNWWADGSHMRNGYEINTGLLFIGGHLKAGGQLDTVERDVANRVRIIRNLNLPEHVHFGGTLQMIWTCESYEKQGKISLFRQGNWVYDIAVDHWLNDGSFNWLIEDTDHEGNPLPDGSDYRIRFMSGDGLVLFETAEFTINHGTIFTITATANSGGTISPSGAVTVEQGEDQDFTISPNPGYDIQDVMIDSVSVGAVPTYTFLDVQANHSIEAFFMPSTTYTVTVDIQSGHGYILPNWICCYKVYTVAAGSSFSVTLRPETGYHGYYYVLVGTGKYNYPANGVINIASVTKNEIIRVYFEAD